MTPACTESLPLIRFIFSKVFSEKLCLTNKIKFKQLACYRNITASFSLPLLWLLRWKSNIKRYLKNVMVEGKKVQAWVLIPLLPLTRWRSWVSLFFSQFFHHILKYMFFSRIFSRIFLLWLSFLSNIINLSTTMGSFLSVLVFPILIKK